MNIVTRLESLRTREHTATVDIIEALLQLKKSQDHLGLGYSTIWAFLVEHLHYSNAAAFRRYKAMKCAEKFPQVLTMLREHRTSLSALAQAERTLAEADDPEQLLAEIDGQPARQVERAVARRNPSKAPREAVRRKYVRKKAAEVSDTDLFDAATEPADEPTLERILISFSLSPDDFEDFERVKSILSRKHPSGLSVETAFRELMTFFLKHKEPKSPEKPAAKTKPTAKTESQPLERKPRTASSNPRHIPRKLRDEISMRDQGRCTYHGRNERRCNSTHDLQIDHIQPVAVGGPTEAGNLRLLCANHNRYRTRDLLPTRKSKGTNGPSQPHRHRLTPSSLLP